MLLQAFYSIRSECQLMERLEFNLPFRWFVGIGFDDAVWDHSTFSKNRARLLEGDVATKLLSRRGTGLLMFLTLCSLIRSKTKAIFFFDLFRHLAGSANALRIGELLEARRDVDAVAVPVRPLEDHFAEIDADAHASNEVAPLSGR
jgi:hypothetical protein